MQSNGSDISLKNISFWRVFFMDKRVEIKIDQFNLTFQFEEQFSIVDEEEINQDLEHRHFTESVLFIHKIVNQLGFEEVFGKYQDRGGVNFYNRVIAFGDYGETALLIGYSNLKREMGIMFHFTAQGLERYISFKRQSQADYTAMNLIQNMNLVVSDVSGSFKFTRMDIATDFIGYEINIDKVANKVLKGLYKAQNERTNKHGTVTTHDINLHLGAPNSLYNAISGSSGIETLYLGNRSGKGNFLRIYDKYRDLFTKGRLTKATFNQTDWVRYELEIKFDSSGQFYFNQFLDLEDSSDYERWLASEVLSRFRLVTDFNRPTVFSEVLTQIANGRVNARAKAEVKEFKDLEESKEHFMSGSSGFQSLLYKIKHIEGQSGIDKFIKELLDYQEEKYEPSKVVLNYVEQNSSNDFVYDLSDDEVLDFILSDLGDV